MATRAGDPDVQQSPFFFDLGRVGGLADRQDALLERGQEDGLPLEPLRPVVGQQFDARSARALGFHGDAPGDLGEEGVGIGRGIACLQLARYFEQGQQGGVTLARLLGGRDLVRLEIESQCPGGRQSRGQWLGSFRGFRGFRGSLPRGCTDRGDRPSDFRSPEESFAPNLERHARRAKRGLEAHQLAVRADEDGDRRCRQALGNQPACLRRDRRLLVRAGRELTDRRRRTVRSGRAQLLRWAAAGTRCRGEQSVGDGKDLGRAAVVRLESNHPSSREPGGEPGQPGRGRTGEGVDRLVRVADHGQVLAATEPRLEEGLLERVRVLVLVDAEPAVAVANLGCSVRIVLDQPDGHLQHVLEVDPAGAFLALLVLAIQRREQVRRQRAVVAVQLDHALVVGRGDPAGLGPFDFAGEVARGDVAVATRQRPTKFREDGHLGGQDVGQVPPRDPGPEVPELAQCRGMERGRDHPRLTERGQPFAHLAGGLVRERHDEDMAGDRHACRQRVRDAP